VLLNARRVWLVVPLVFVIKYAIFVVIFLGLGWAFFLQKQHEKKAALESRKRQEQAVVKAHVTPSPADRSLKGLPKQKPTPVLGPVPTLKPKPTPMLPKPTPMLQQTP
jgi:hypothetical protein